MTETTPSSANDQVHILIVEDSPTQAERLKYTLERQGYAVTSATNGRQALSSAHANRPTLIISDIIMPEMDGYQLCQQIKTDPELKNIPVILVTTLSDPQDVIRALECRADNFVTKPYEERYLLSRIQFILKNYKVAQQDDAAAGIEIYFDGRRHFITADRRQILNLLLSTYEVALQRNQELTNAKDALRAANDSLESTNKELEAFSYSVSHDLRAPVRAIEGFSKALFESHAPTFDDSGKDLFVRIQNACQRMQQLIDDLLNLSRIGRVEMKRAPVDLGALAKAIISDLQKQQPQREVGIQIAEGLVADGDARLLQAALENLIGNAWKFTSKTSAATIEFGAMMQDGRKTFFIRDNGAGFDMAYAKRLFGAFQRLHSTSEFPGTGVGLATVQRIIHRHGGRIWAQGAPGAGAAFYFSL